MYNEQLEALIDAALADGVLTEKEKQVLFKKAQAMGVDLDEFEMVLDSRLVKLQKAEAEKEQAAAPKSEKFGDVRKCPACGAIVPALAGVCPECGFEFSGIDANSSSQELALLLIEIESSNREKENILDLKRTSIESYPIPATKADLFEFISSLSSKAQTGEKKLRGAYKTKLDECILKAQSLFPSDKELLKLVGEIKKTNKQRLQKKIILFGSVAILVALLITIPIVKSRSPKTNYDTCVEAVLKAVDKGNLEKAQSYINNYSGHYYIPKAYGSLCVAYINAGEVEKAKKLVKKYPNKHEDVVCKPLYDYLMENGLYEEAEEYIPGESYGNNISDEAYYNYIKKSLEIICQKAGAREAKKFLTKKTDFFKDDMRFRYSKKTVIRDLSAVIESY